MTAALANDRGFFSSLGIVDAERIEVLELALDGISVEDSRRALVLSSLCKELAFGGSLEQRSSLAEDAIGLARSSGDDASLVRVLVHVTFPLLVPGLIAQSTARAEESLSLAGALGDPQLHFWAAWCRGLVAATARDVDEVDRCLEIMDGLAKQLNQPTITWAVTLEHAMRAQLAGDVDSAEMLATDALQIGTDGGEPDAESVFGVQLMAVSYERGNMGDLVPLIEEAATSLTGMPTFSGALALAHAEADRTTEARACLDAFEAAGFQLPMDAGWLTGMNCYAAAAVECRDPRFAGPIFEQLDPWSDQLSFGVASTEGPVAHYVAGLLSVLGRHAEAESRYEESAGFCEQVGAKCFAALTDLSWGRMLVERDAPGDWEQGKVLLRSALTSATANGYGTVERRAAAAIADLD